jgi:DnaJ-class molecular chaperone
MTDKTTCPRCHGSGRIAHGNRRLSFTYGSDPGDDPEMVPCYACSGKGGEIEKGRLIQDPDCDWQYIWIPEATP